jgi:hypothetical protein
MGRYDRILSQETISRQHVEEDTVALCRLRYVGHGMMQPGCVVEKSAIDTADMTPASRHNA